MALLTQFWGLDGLIILFCALIGVYLYFTRNFKHWKKRGVKEVSPTAFLGNFGPCIMARKPLANLLQEIYKAGEDEPYIGYYVLDKPHLMIRDPELIKYVLIKDFNNFPDRNSQSHSSDVIGRTNILVAKSPDWKYIRQRLSPVFSSARLKKMFDLMLEIDKDLDVYIDSLKLGGEGRDLEMKDICAKFTTDSIGITAYGMRFNCLTDPDALLRKAGKDLFKTSYKRYIELLSAWLIPLLVKIFGFHIFSKGAGNFLKAVFFEAIDERIKSGAKRADLIDLLIDLKKEQEKDTHQNKLNVFEGDVLTAQSVIFFAGGFETSSSTMSFALYELARNPEIQTRLREEILDTLEKNDGKLTYDMIMSSLPYLDMVVSETLRMYPVLHFLDRKTIADYQLPGTKLTIKSGTPVVIPMMALQMDANYFPKPEIFDPERFSDANKKNIAPNTYFPFGDGPRICIGMRIGLLQSKLGLLHLVSKYEFSPCKKTLIPMKFDNYNMFVSSRDEIVLHMKKIPTNG